MKFFSIIRKRELYSISQKQYQRQEQNCLQNCSYRKDFEKIKDLRYQRQYDIKPLHLKRSKKVFKQPQLVRLQIASHLKISLYHENWTFLNTQRKKLSLLMHSILSSYTVEPSFIYSNEPTISRYIHENHKAERVQTFSKFSVLIYNASLHFFASVVDHELSQKWYCKMINT